MYWTKTPQVTNITCGQNIKDKMLDYTGNLNSSWISRCSSWDFEKAEEAKIKLSTSTGSSKKAREFQKTIYFCFIDYAKAFDCVDHNKLWKILRDWNTRPLDLPLEKSVRRSGSNC